MSQFGKYMIFIGLLIIITGFLIILIGNKFNWLGNLPGDLKIEKENFKFYFPITSSILISIILSVFIWLFRKFFK